MEPCQPRWNSPERHRIDYSAAAIPTFCSTALDNAEPQRHRTTPVRLGHPSHRSSDETARLKVIPIASPKLFPPRPISPPDVDAHRTLSTTQSARGAGGPSSSLHQLPLTSHHELLSNRGQGRGREVSPRSGSGGQGPEWTRRSVCFLFLSRMDIMQHSATHVSRTPLRPFDCPLDPRLVIPGKRHNGSGVSPRLLVSPSSCLAPSLRSRRWQESLQLLFFPS